MKTWLGALVLLTALASSRAEAQTPYTINFDGYGTTTCYPVDHGSTYAGNSFCVLPKGWSTYASRWIGTVVVKPTLYTHYHLGPSNFASNCFGSGANDGWYGIMGSDGVCHVPDPLTVPRVIEGHDSFEIIDISASTVNNAGQPIPSAFTGFLGVTIVPKGAHSSGSSGNICVHNYSSGMWVCFNKKPPGTYSFAVPTVDHIQLSTANASVDTPGAVFDNVIVE